MRRRLAIVLSFVLGLGLVGVAAGPAQAEARTTGFRWHDIAAADGVVLKSNVIAPATPGRHPGIVFVASWGLNDFQYLAQAKVLAERGYVVLSYTTRGFYLSGGKIDVGGPPDVADANSAVSWLIANTDVDRSRIGMVGVSYGAGIALLAGAHDSRVRAVAAMSGWADMAASLHGGDTRRPQAAFFLQTVANVVGRPSDEMNTVLADYWAGRNDEYRERWARERSVRYDLEAYNRNRPATLITHQYGDSVFPANQMVDLYNSLTGPKRIELAPGDHATAEILGLAGLPNRVWDSQRRWFDRYLMGVGNGVDREPGVVLRPHASGATESYVDWRSVATGTDRVPLAATSFRAGSDTVATAGVALVTNGLEGFTGIPPTVWLPAVDRRDAAVWTSPPYPTGTRLRGIPRLHLDLGSAAPTGTLVAYLYDVDAVGHGRLVSHAPYSWLVKPATPVELPLQVTAADIPAGHRIGLVVDTKDLLYLDADVRGATVTTGDGSWLDLPVR
jgi:predicted acyl esterase